MTTAGHTPHGRDSRLPDLDPHTHHSIDDPKADATRRPGDGGRRPNGLALVALAALLWGTVGIASRFLFDLSTLDPLTVGAWRLVLAAPLMAVLAARLPGGPLDRRDIGALVLLGLSQAAYQGLYFGAVARVGVTLATLLALCAAPVLVALLARLVLREPLGARTLVAVALSVVGVALLVGVPGPMSAGAATVGVGVAMAGAAAVSYAVFTLTSRALARRHHPFRIIALGFGVGAVVLAALAGAARLTGGAPLWPDSAVAWGVVLYMGLVPTALAYGLFLWGMRRATATGSAVVVLLEPLTAAVLAWGLFGERLGPLGLIGGALLLGAVALLAAWRGGTARG
ncbi:DMT family transporter [Roseospira visakhapatnamensis]|uniref:DME family drug/metabolite transporter n=1 Tax=Roseospira visakhapatnamensis TaxID=390880 RepID=A0A7W6REW4_9PROT|nr:DMT family transporter [Roseospira visakhapatnamensis]MBB4267266.1 DME family drug/metabolite transporter [Roseospira visakhapatnamensis]